MDTLAIVVAVAVGATNAFVTIAIIRGRNLKSLTRAQVVAQSLIVWLLPVLGAIVVWLVLREESQPFRPPSNEANPYTEFTASNYDSQHHGGPQP